MISIMNGGLDQSEMPACLENWSFRNEKEGPSEPEKNM